MRSCEADWRLSQSLPTCVRSRPIHRLCPKPSKSSLPPRRSRIQTASLLLLSRQAVGASLPSADEVPLPLHPYRAGGRAGLGGFMPAAKRAGGDPLCPRAGAWRTLAAPGSASSRSEEHTSELQSRQYLVCRLLLEKKKI